MMEALAGGLTAVAVPPPAFSRTLFHHQFLLVFLEFLISPFLLALSPLLKITFLKVLPLTKMLFGRGAAPHWPCILNSL